jgi:hypothetical protein
MHPAVSISDLYPDFTHADPRRIASYMSLISFASEAYSEVESGGNTKWSDDFRRLVGTIHPTSHEITMVLTLCSAAIRSGEPLPPYVPKPRPFELTSRLEELDKDILSVRHINEPGYAAFAVMQLSARGIGVDVDRLLSAVRDLVGELDFTVKVVRRDIDTESDLINADDKSKAD